MQTAMEPSIVAYMEPAMFRAMLLKIAEMRDALKNLKNHLATHPEEMQANPNVSCCATNLAPLARLARVAADVGRARLPPAESGDGLCNLHPGAKPRRRVV